MGIHGDILDSTVLKSLKLGTVDTTNNVFKLFANITPAIFWVSSALVIASSYIGDPIKCMLDKDVDIANTLCWIHGTYHIDDKISEAIYGSVCKRSYTTYGSELSKGDRDADTSYYQWVPFMLVIHGLIFLISAKIWKVLENGLLEQFGTKKDISRLVEAVEISKVAKEKANRFMALSRNANNRYFIYFVLCEIGNIAAAIFNFYLIDMHLGGRFKYYGSDVVAYSATNDRFLENPICSAFPTMTSCDVRFAGVNGATDIKNTLCILPQNIINGKIYLAIWFWMVILLIACAINAIYRIAQVVVVGMRKRELVCLINTRRMRAEFLDKDNIVREHWKELNKIGSWFLMCQIGRNSNPYYFRQFLQCLIENDKDKKKSTRSINGVGEENVDIEEGTLKKPLF
jgi:hypothetical protein